MIDEGYIESDYDLKVTNDALLVTDKNYGIISGLLGGDIKHQLPVVYVSKTSQNRNPINVNWLCNRLRGVAHVLVQEDISTNSIIRESCNDSNEYYGAIGVYYPSDALGHKRCVYRDNNENQLMELVVNFVLKYGILQQVDRLYTWSGVSNSFLHDRLDSQMAEKLKAELARSKAENEKDDVYAEFDNELKRLQRRIDELTRDNDSKSREIQVLRAKLSGIEDEPLIMLGSEKEKYPDEIKDFVLSSLNDSLKNEISGSRKEYVLRDLIEANNYEGLGNERKRKIKLLLKGYTNMSGAIRQGLEDLGLEVIEDGKHYKIRYKGDQRLLITLSKTSSDHRAGDNTASEICNLLL